MTQDQYDTMSAFTQQFSEMRKVYNDQQLLDWCQVVMAVCTKDMKDGPFDPSEPPPEGQEPLTLGQKMEGLIAALQAA